MLETQIVPRGFLREDGNITPLSRNAFYGEPEPSLRSFSNTVKEALATLDDPAKAGALGDQLKGALEGVRVVRSTTDLRPPPPLCEIVDDLVTKRTAALASKGLVQREPMLSKYPAVAGELNEWLQAGEVPPLAELNLDSALGREARPPGAADAQRLQRAIDSVVDQAASRGVSVRPHDRERLKTVVSTFVEKHADEVARQNALAALKKSAESDWEH